MAPFRPRATWRTALTLASVCNVVSDSWSSSSPSRGSRSIQPVAAFTTLQQAMTGTTLRGNGPPKNPNDMPGDATWLQDAFTNFPHIVDEYPDLEQVAQNIMFINEDEAALFLEQSQPGTKRPRPATTWCMLSFGIFETFNQKDKTTPAPPPKFVTETRAVVLIRRVDSRDFVLPITDKKRHINLHEFLKTDLEAACLVRRGFACVCVGHFCTRSQTI